MNRHTELTSLLRGLRLQAMADCVSEVALKAARANLSHEAFLYELARLEQEQRTQRRVERLRRESGLPREKTFATLELASFSPLVRQQVERLRRGEFVKEAVNVVAVGPPGVGESHVLASVAHTLIEQGMSVLWSSTAQLMQRLLAAKRDLRLPQELARLDRYACLVLDDIGYVQHDQDEMEVLFTLLSERYERRSVMLSTNLVFSEWTRMYLSIEKWLSRTLILVANPLDGQVAPWYRRANGESFVCAFCSPASQRRRRTMFITAAAIRCAKCVFAWPT